MNRFFRHSISNLVILLIITSLIVCPIPVKADSIKTLDLSSALIAQNKQPKKAPKYKPPERKTDSSLLNFISLSQIFSRLGRGACSNVKSSLTAVVPLTQMASDGRFLNAYTATTESQPTFWFYVPDLSKSIEQRSPTHSSFAEFILQNKNGVEKKFLIRLSGPSDPVDEYSIQPIVIKLSVNEQKEQPKLVGFRLPQTETFLEINQLYHWYFSLICDARRPSRNPSVDAWIERQSVSSQDLREKLTAASDLERTSLYALNGYWFDALTLLAKMHCANLKDEILINDWTEFLLGSDVGLEEIAHQKFEQCLPNRAS